MRIILLSVVLLLPTFVVAAEVYRWVDDNGEAHYSDRPQEGAERITIQEAQTFSAPAVKSRSSSNASGSTAAAEDKDAASYSNVEITSPKQEEVFWNVGGEISVSLRTRPRVRSGHVVFLIMDGQEVQQLQRGRTQARLQDVVRGTHSLLAEVRDASGNTVAKSDAISFTVQQTSIQNPNNPNRPPVAAPRGPAG